MYTRKYTHYFAIGLFLLAGLSLSLAVTAQAQDEAPPPDEIVLKNGSRILGTITGARDGVVTIETDFAGELSVTQEQISEMKSAEPARMMLADDSVIEQGIVVADSELLVDPATPEQKTYALDDLLVVNPEPWELGQGYNWTGLVSFAFAVERGNSETDEVDYRLDSMWRSVRDRYTVNLTGEYDKANDLKSADNWLLLGKYDYFLSDITYWGAHGSAEADEFKDLDLRYLVGPYIGRDFLTDPLFTLSAEIGASYVNEDFITAEDQDYPGANWYLRMTSDYFGGDSQLYFDQRGIWNLDHTSDVVIDTRVGLSFPLLWSLEAAAEILWEYDTGAGEGVEDLDETYAFRIGYTW